MTTTSRNIVYTSLTVLGLAVALMPGCGSDDTTNTTQTGPSGPGFRNSEEIPLPSFPNTITPGQ